MFKKVVSVPLTVVWMSAGGVVLQSAWAQERPRSLEAVTQELALAKGDYDACRRNLGDVLAQYTTQAEELRKLKEPAPEAKPPGDKPAASAPVPTQPKEGQP